MVPLMPSWKSVQSAFPEILEEFYQIVEEDNDMYLTQIKKI